MALSVSSFERLLLAGALVLAGAGCTADAAEPRWRGTLHRDGSAVEVRNPADPVFGDGAAAAEPLWTAPGASGDDGAGDWGQPTRLALGEGAVYVLDPTAHAVHVLDRAGRPLREIGREGRGPGELQAPFGLALVDGLLAVGDAGKGTMELFSPAGGSSRSFPLGIVALSMSGLEPGGLLVMDHRGGHWLYDARGGRRPVSLPAAGEDGRGAQVCGRAWSTGREILRLDCTRPAFQVISRAGALLRTVRTRREPAAATEAELARYRRTLAADAARTGMSPGEARGMIELLLKDQSPRRSMRGVRYDPAARMYALWEQQPTELGNGPARLHLFGAEGVFLATLPFAEPWVDFAIEGLTVYALAEDRDTGLVRLAAYRVVLAPEVAKLAAAPIEPEASQALSSSGASR